MRSISILKIIYEAQKTKKQKRNKYTTTKKTNNNIDNRKETNTIVFITLVE